MTFATILNVSYESLEISLHIGTEMPEQKGYAYQIFISTSTFWHNHL